MYSPHSTPNRREHENYRKYNVFLKFRYKNR